MSEMLGGHDYGREKEQWLHTHHWDSKPEVHVTQVGQPGQQPLGVAVAVGKTRRIREVTVRHEGVAQTTIEIYVDADCIISFQVAATSSVTWHSEDGREVAEGKIPHVRSSVPGVGGTYVTAAGVEAA
jgi:hypothetical protein